MRPSKLAEFDFDESTINAVSNNTSTATANSGIAQAAVPSLATAAAVAIGGAGADYYSPANSAGQTSLPQLHVVGQTRHPPRQPRVATMDKILNDLIRNRKEPTASSNMVPPSLSLAATTTVPNSQSMDVCSDSADRPAVSSLASEVTGGHVEDSVQIGNPPGQLPNAATIDAAPQGLIVAPDAAPMEAPMDTSERLGDMSLQDRVSIVEPVSNSHVSAQYGVDVLPSGGSNF